MQVATAISVVLSALSIYSFFFAPQVLDRESYERLQVLSSLRINVHGHVGRVCKIYDTPTGMLTGDAAIDPSGHGCANAVPMLTIESRTTLAKNSDVIILDDSDGKLYAISEEAGNELLDIWNQEIQ